MGIYMILTHEKLNISNIVIGKGAWTIERMTIVGEKESTKEM